jgi:pyruvate kinase
VVALGPWADTVTRALGYDFPLAVKRGYHMHYRAAGEARLSTPLLDAERGYFLAPMRRGIRLTTGAEFALREAIRTPVRLGRAEPIARELFPLAERLDAEPWMGSRPCTPDMLPIIGRAPRHPSLFFAFGHAHHGFTLGAATGRLVAEMASGEAPFVDPAPYSPERFLWRGYSICGPAHAQMKRGFQSAKIVCTLGPATDAPGVLEAMIEAGMDVARVNLSHGTLAEHERRIAEVRQASRKLGLPVGILADLPGPKYRLGKIDGGSHELQDGARVFLAEAASGADTLPVPQPALLAALRAGESVYLADGAVRLRVVGTAAGRAECEVAAGGTVRSGSGLNAPQVDLPGLVPTELDRAMLAFAAAQAVDWVGVSFVQGADDLERVRACLPGGAGPLLMAKIEKRRALSSLEAIVESADAVMVARGDLGVETDLAEIPVVQKRLIAAANERMRPVLTATQMLESMVERDRPTRAEVSDVANAVLDGTDAVMLSAESAIGRSPLAAVQVLQRVIAATLDEYAGPMARARLQAGGPFAEQEAVGLAACQLADALEARAIIAHVHDLRHAAAIARFRPRVPIVALTDSAGACGALTLVSGVFPLYSSERTVAPALDWLYANGLARPGERAIVVSISPGGGENADTLRVMRLGGHG